MSSTYHFASYSGCVNQASANQVGHARRRGNGHGEGDLVRDGCNRRDDALGREVIGPEAAGQERQDFKSEPLGFDHDHTRQRQPDHDPPVAERSLAEAAPAFAAVDEADIAKEENRKDVLRNRHGNGRANEAVLQLPDEQPGEEDVEGGGKQENVRRGLEEALRLREALAALKQDDAGDGKDHDAEVEGSKASRLRVGHHALQDWLGSE
ncbi:hypothetical protein MKX07_008308 [Trichoderma sp. CBMAI-0711]|nr:hypothetical protein MKX07_008308 [Trichoderma sp. CBMAI-0711]